MKNLMNYYLIILSVFIDFLFNELYNFFFLFFIDFWNLQYCYLLFRAISIFELLFWLHFIHLYNLWIQMRLLGWKLQLFMDLILCLDFLLSYLFKLYYSVFLFISDLVLYLKYSACLIIAFANLDFSIEMH